jgi:hypothetical protein
LQPDKDCVFSGRHRRIFIVLTLKDKILQEPSRPGNRYLLFRLFPGKEGGEFLKFLVGAENDK